MNFLDLNQEEKKEILNECINTKKTFKTIADKYKIKTEDVYKVINEFCEQKGYKGFTRTTKNGGVFINGKGEFVKSVEDKNIVIGKVERRTKEQKLKEIRIGSMKKIQEIEDWCIENGWKPRSIIRYIANCKGRRRRNKGAKRIKIRKTI